MPDEMRWPTQRHKLWPVAVDWFRGWPWWTASVHTRVWYFGPWLWVQIGPLSIRFGGGTYDAD